jgi:hypothetical protein
MPDALCQYLSQQLLLQDQAARVPPLSPDATATDAAVPKMGAGGKRKCDGGAPNPAAHARAVGKRKVKERVWREVE